MGFRAASSSYGEGSLAKRAEQIKQVGIREFILALDADEAGKKGTASAAAALGSTGISVRTVVWPTALPNGFDLNDVILRNGEDRLRTLLQGAPLWSEELQQAFLEWPVPTPLDTIAVPPFPWETLEGAP